MATGPCNVYELNQSFLDALEFMDPMIADRSFTTKRLYFNMIPRGVYTLGEGIVRKLHKFYGSRNDQSNLTNWRSIQISRPAAGADPGYDSCRYESDMIEYAFETLQFTGFETTRRSKHICLNDIKWKWEFRQQLELIFGFLADVTLQIWENYGREMYLKMAADQSQIYVLQRGSPDSLPLTTDYDPLVSGDMVISRDIDISTLDWSFMDWWYQYLNIQAPMSALGEVDGMPQFGLVVHAKDWDWMIRNNADVREDFRLAQPTVLIEQYGKVKSYKGFAIIHDQFAPRFKVKAGGIAADDLTLERVDPYTTTSTTIGDKPVINTEYLNAEYALGVIFINKVFSTLVPPSGPATPGGGTKFGAVPSLNGEFKWLNILDECENPLGEKGYYFGRFQAFAKPEEYSGDAIAFLYKRCPHVDVVLCEPCEDTGTGWLTITAATEIIGTGEAANAVTQVSITLSECLPCEAPAELNIDYDGAGGSDVTAVLIDDSAAPTYVIGFTTAADWVAGGTIVAGTSTITCV